MSVMFEEEVSKLKLQIVNQQEQLTAGERNAQRLSGLLNEEKQRADALNVSLEAAKEDAEAARNRLSVAQRAVERLQGLEEAVTEAQNVAREYQDSAQTLRLELVKTISEKKRLTESLSTAEARLTLLESQVLPLEELVGALKASQRASSVIEEQLKELKIGADPD